MLLNCFEFMFRFCSNDSLQHLSLCHLLQVFHPSHAHILTIRLKTQHIIKVSNKEYHDEERKKVHKKNVPNDIVIRVLP